MWLQDSSTLESAARTNGKEISMNEFDPNIYIKTVTIVGVGGTGAQVARIVGRIVYDLQRSQRHAPQIVLIDPDTVEEKNVGRQLFSPSVLGMHKAAVVGKMLNLALGLDVCWIPDYVDPVRHFERYGGNLVVSCVDNHEARQAIYQVDGVLIGAGNHENAGQVCIGNCVDLDQIGRSLDGHDGKYSYLPKEGLLFPELLQPEPNASCAELVMSGDQHLLVNDMVAIIVGQYIYKLLHRLPIHSFLTYVAIGDFITTRSLPICRDELEVYL
jgi:PRTRC genetic system ThiF family protein